MEFQYLALWFWLHNLVIDTDPTQSLVLNLFTHLEAKKGIYKVLWVKQNDFFNAMALQPSYISWLWHLWWVLAVTGLPCCWYLCHSRTADCQKWYRMCPSSCSHRDVTALTFSALLSWIFPRKSWVNVTVFICTLLLFESTVLSQNYNFQKFSQCTAADNHKLG